MLLLISDGVDDDVNLATACRRLRLLLECWSGVVMIAETHQHLITMISWSHLRKNHNKSRDSQHCQQYQRWLIIERCLQITFLFNIVTNNILTWDMRDGDESWEVVELMRLQPKYYSLVLLHLIDTISYQLRKKFLGRTHSFESLQSTSFCCFTGFCSNLQLCCSSHSSSILLVENELFTSTVGQLI